MAKTQNEERGTAATLESGRIPPADGGPPTPVPPPAPRSIDEAFAPAFAPAKNPPPPRPGPRLGVGLPVHVCDHNDGRVHAAIVTHVNDEAQSIIATVFKPNETLVGVGFERSELGLATPGRWHWPDWMTGE
jgi:hypothetical protein